MLCVINKVDQTNNVPYESISIATVAGDQAGQATFQVIDPGATLSLALMQEVIFIDEAATYGSNTSPMIPTHNYLADNNFNYGATYGSGDSNVAWTTNASGIPTSTITFPANPTFGTGAHATLTLSNNPVGYVLSGQSVTNSRQGFNYAIPGQTYYLSGTVNITQAFTNAYTMLKISFQDVTNTIITSQESTHLTATGSQRLSVSLVAPANTVTIRTEFGGVTNTTTNSGTATFTALQLEPQWFPALYSYPTPICDILTADSANIVDFTTTRFNRIFCGNITDLVASYEGTTRTWDVTAISLDGLLENSNLYTVNGGSSPDQSYIGAALPLTLNALAPGLLAGTPQALAFANTPPICIGVTAAMQFADATPREVCNSFANMSGFLFGVDAYYNAFYYPPTYNVAPYGFSSSPDNSTTFAYYDYSIEYDGSQLQNITNVSGSTYSLSVTESWKAQDNSHQEGISSGNTFGWALFHTPNGAPTSVVVGGTTLNCQLGTNNGWGSATAQYNTSNPVMNILNPVAAGTSISVTYPYNAIIYAQAQSPDSIGAYGAMYSKINDTNLTSNADAAIRGEAQLFAYSQPLTTIKFKTQKQLTPGQVINFTSALDNLTNAHFAVQKVTATCLGNGTNQYEIQAGNYIDDFVDFFRNTQKAVNRAAHDPADPIKQYNLQVQDSLSLSDGLNIHT